MKIEMRPEYTTIFSGPELAMVVRALIGRLRQDEVEEAQRLANQITEQRASQFEKQAIILRDMIPKDDQE